jgi:hypothetical protein
LSLCSNLAYSCIRGTPHSIYINNEFLNFLAFGGSVMMYFHISSYQPKHIVICLYSKVVEVYGDHASILCFFMLVYLLALGHCASLVPPVFNFNPASFLISDLMSNDEWLIQTSLHACSDVPSDASFSVTVLLVLLWYYCIFS